MAENEQMSVKETKPAVVIQNVELAKNFASFTNAGGASKGFGYEKLDSAATKNEFDTLDLELNKRKSAIANARVTLEEATPYLARMQALLSQRGADRKNVLRDARVPSWSEWVEKYASELNYTVRTLQAHIKELREPTKGTGRSGNVPRHAEHYTKTQTNMMVSTCNLAIEARKASEAGRPVHSILAKIQMDAARLLEINELAERLPDYRKCTERLLSVIEKYAKGEVPQSKIVEVARGIRKEVTPKLGEASLAGAANAGNPRNVVSEVIGATGTRQASTITPATSLSQNATNPEHVERKRRRATTRGAVSNQQHAKTKLTGIARAKESRGANRAIKKGERGEGSEAAATPQASSMIVYKAFPGGPVVREFTSGSSCAWEAPTIKYAVCYGTESQSFLSLEEARTACDNIAKRMGTNSKSASVAACGELQIASA